ncbi:tRNA uridine(34) 5-carboxymethylaminomethyl modification radical SAM/GNAT enzyme Elp3 [uncultured Slackia sp.]|uniref:elongator complex protein 3 n=1 Tax=uncultured Slackia sp. TaxID=665903 RepID=UPI00280ADCD4|nr:tRNA uridine(34) 5-carboxymethylaminomethyl modification radical SAM/GNAT enzyme Elp3 [uncultured Slackia sp.]
MDTILLEIIEEIRRGTAVDHKVLARILHEHNKNLKDNRDHFAKKHLLPYYFNAKNTKEELWRSWNVDEQTERALIAALQMKPRRTASGVATITVITKPWFCGNDCLYCPNDVRMPKSYLHNEPACQRAERNWFDPYLQVASRLRALSQMGHPTDKIELIVLGGTWDDYPSEYRTWFMAELFRALNDGDAMEAHAAQRRALYREAGILNDEQGLASAAKDLQEAVNDGKSSFADALRALYGNNAAWAKASAMQHATLEEVDRLQEENERAQHRCVGLVVETRPETITAPKLALLRRLGCTKVQVGIQSLNENVLALNNRRTDPRAIQEAFALLRLFGFKIHAHFMVNLYGATPEADKLDYEKFVTDPHYLPDEVKLYPCALVEGTGLVSRYEDGSWRPYTEEELVDVLSHDTLITPPYMRISRMIRDISACDILVGNKKTNLRQMVEGHIEKTGHAADVRDIRYREINNRTAEASDLTLHDVEYETAVSTEHFLQWTTEDNRIAGFLRLSLPRPDAVAAREGLPIKTGQAMIREVHVYGAAAKLHATSKGAQHIGLGRKLVETACDMAKEAGYESANVISAVGTREYYRNLGFNDAGLYQNRPLCQ